MKSKHFQVFLLHFAGGSCYSYRFLRKYFLKNIEVHPLELPGRGKRLKEKLITNIDIAIKDYIEQIIELRNGEKFILYGHSMGGLMAAYISQKLEDYGDAPDKIIITGNAGPNISVNKKMHLMSEKAFISNLKKIGSIPDEILGKKELLNFFIPILKADFHIMEGAPLPPLKIRTDIIAIMGEIEEYSEYVFEWQKISTGNVTTKKLPGGHFFIQNHPKEIATEINNCI